MDDQWVGTAYATPLSDINEDLPKGAPPILGTTPIEKFVFVSEQDDRAWHKAMDAGRNNACPECGSGEIEATLLSSHNRAECLACGWTGKEADLVSKGEI